VGRDLLKRLHLLGEARLVPYRSVELGELIEHKDERRDASREYQENECCGASGNKPQPPRRESPCEGEKRSRAEPGTHEPKPQERDGGNEPARGTKLDPLLTKTSFPIGRAGI
jgi:hypothetical protein